MFHNEMSQQIHLHEGQVKAVHNQNTHSMQPYEEQWYPHLRPYLQTWTGHCIRESGVKKDEEANAYYLHSLQNK